MIEKRRRDRINNSLTELRRLVPSALLSVHIIMHCFLPQLRRIVPSALFSVHIIMHCILPQVIEKRRRDRINNSLTELRRLVPSALLSVHIIMHYF